MAKSKKSAAVKNVKPVAVVTPAPVVSPTERYRDSAALLKMVGDPTRIAILASIEAEALSVSAIMVAVGADSQPATSHHLALLRHVGAVRGDRNGKEVYYSLAERGRALIKAIESVG